MATEDIQADDPPPVPQLSIVINEDLKLATVNNLDMDNVDMMTEFSTQKATIPDDCAIEFLPTLFDSRVPELGFEGRELYFTSEIVYVTEPLEGGGYVVRPTTHNRQFLTAVGVQAPPNPYFTARVGNATS